jgi:hypothetical protein
LPVLTNTLEEDVRAVAELALDESGVLGLVPLFGLTLVLPLSPYFSTEHN